MLISLNDIDKFIEILDNLLKDESSSYLREHIEAILKAARFKRVEYDSVLNE